MKLTALLRRHPRLSLVGILLLLLAGIWVWLRPSPPTLTAAPTASPAALTVSVIAPRHQNWPMILSANGSISAWQEAVVGAEIGGLQLTELRVDVGDTVRKGQLLAHLQDETVRARIHLRHAQA